MKSSPPPRIEVLAAWVPRACVLALGGLASLAVAMSQAPAWAVLVIALLAWIEWPRAGARPASLVWDEETRIVRRGPLVVVHSRGGRALVWAGAAARRELARWAGAHSRAVRASAHGLATGRHDV